MHIHIQRTSKSRISEVDFNNIPFGKVFSDHMFIVDFNGKDWVDARIEPYSNLSISPAISALHYGQSIFEGLKAYRYDNGEARIFRPDANWLRMNKSAERLCMPQMDQKMFVEGIRSLVELDQNWIPEKGGYSLYIRPFMFATDEYVGIRPSETYRFVIFTCPVGSYYSGMVNVKVSDHYVRAFPRGTGYAKVAGNYAAGMMPLKHAREEGFDQLLWLDGKEMKYVEESGTMNLFFVIDDTLITPVADGTILEGITRDSVLKLAQDLEIKTQVRKIAIEEVFEAYNYGKLKDAFGTGTAATIAQLNSITYKGYRMQLPPAEERPISNLLGQTLDDIRHGRAEDRYNWMIKV